MRTALLAIAVFGLALGGSSTGWAADPIKWRLGTPYISTRSPMGQQLRQIVEEVNDKAGGRLKLELVDLVAAGFRPADALRAAKQGVSEIIHFNREFLNRDEPLIAALPPHGALLSPADNLAIKDQADKFLADILARKWNVVYVAPSWQEPVEMSFFSRQPVTSLDSLRKMKVRHWSSLGINAFKKLGVSAQAIPTPDLYTALKTGVVDGTMMVKEFGLALSFYEPAPYYFDIHPGTLVALFGFMSPNDKWSKLPRDLRDLIQDVMLRYSGQNFAGWFYGNNDRMYDAKLKAAGAKHTAGLPEADRKAFQNAFLAAWGEEAKAAGPEGERIYNSLVATLRRAAEQRPAK